MSITKLNNLSLSAVTALPSGVGGKVLQVVSTTVTTASAVSTSTSHVDIPGMTLTITPSSTSNKILIMWKCMFSNGTGDAHFGFLNRNGTDIALGTSSGQDDLSTFPMLTANSNDYWGFDATGTFLDSPSSTSALTYKLQVCGQGSYTMYFNRSKRGTYDGCYISTITAMEIAA